ncbi:MAG TPA: HdeD family acid-resistance protein [Terriglobales bacterium]|nr:HdeD family acid-resistance protein [Terriglobales bacterium]
MADQTVAGVVRQGAGWSIVWGVLLVVCGLLAIASPGIASIAVTVAIAWILIFAGVVHMVLAFSAHKASGFFWKFLVGVAYVFFGGYLLWHPLLAVASLTLVLASLFLVEGVLDILLYAKIRSQSGSGWVLVDAIATLLLGGLIYVHWPSSSAWALGTLVGVSMLISGITRIMLSQAVRKLAAPMETPKAA